MHSQTHSKRFMKIQIVTSILIEIKLKMFQFLLYSNCYELLGKCGIAEEQINLRYADDLLVFGQSLEEVVSMPDSLTEVLHLYGLELNLKKTIFLSTGPAPDNTQISITKHGSVKKLSSTSKPKYFGRGFCGDVNARGKAVGNGFAKSRHK